MNMTRVYTKEVSHEDYISLLLYLDDMLLSATSISLIKKFKEQLISIFEMEELGAARRILGMDIIRNIFKFTLHLS